MGEVGKKSELNKQTLALVGTQTPEHSVQDAFPKAKVYLGNDGTSVFERFPTARWP